MQTDRDLLEAAARAVDFVGCEYGELSGGAPVLYVPGVGVWDPLQDDGDALRLAAKLRMKIRITDYGCAARIADGDAWSSCETHLHGGIEAATRRAIVRAAAALAPQAQGQQQGEA